MAGKKPGKKVLIVAAVILLAVAATGYAATRGALGLKAYGLIQNIFYPGEPAPPADNLPDDPANPSGQTPEDPLPEPDPQTPPADHPGETPADDPLPPASETVIYTGQSLVIPLAGETSEGGASQVINRGTLPTGSRQIALTFDSGWLYEQTIPLLDVLDQYSVTATFFPRALWVKDHPDLAREIVFRGHTVGNHSLTHSHMRELSADQIRQEMRQSTDIIQSTTGVRPYLFRPPYGEYNQQMLDILGREGYPYTIMWTVDTHDWADEIGGKTVTVDYVVNRVLENACPNAIMLMHVGGPKTVQALPRIITGLRDMGYTFATVDKLLPPPHDNLTIHVVKPGETLYSISQKYGVTVQQIISANNL